MNISESSSTVNLVQAAIDAGIVEPGTQLAEDVLYLTERAHRTLHAGPTIDQVAEQINAWQPPLGVVITRWQNLKRLSPNVVLVDANGMAYQAVEVSKNAGCCHFFQCGGQIAFESEHMASVMPVRYVDDGRRWDTGR